METLFRCCRISKPAALLLPAFTQLRPSCSEAADGARRMFLACSWLRETTLTQVEDNGGGRKQEVTKETGQIGGGGADWDQSLDGACAV